MTALPPLSLDAATAFAAALAGDDGLATSTVSIVSPRDADIRIIESPRDLDTPGASPGPYGIGGGIGGGGVPRLQLAELAAATATAENGSNSGSATHAPGDTAAAAGAGATGKSRRESLFGDIATINTVRVKRGRATSGALAMAALGADLAGSPRINASGARTNRPTFVPRLASLPASPLDNEVPLLDRKPTVLESQLPRQRKKFKLHPLHNPLYFFAWFTFDWITPFMLRCLFTHPEIKDLPRMRGGDKVKRISGTFRKIYAFFAQFRERSRLLRATALINALLVTFFVPFVLSNVLKLFQEIVLLSGPILLQFFLQALDSDTEPYWTGYCWAAGFFAQQILASVLNQQTTFFVNSNLGMRARSAVTAAIFKKMLKLSNQARQRRPAGFIVALLNVDALKVETLFKNFPFMWGNVLEFLGALAYMFYFLRLAAFAGVGVLILSLPVQLGILVFAGLFISRIRKNMDERLKSLNEYLTGIRIIKFMNWERFYEKRIRVARGRELGFMTGLSVLFTGMITTISAVPTLFAAASFMVYAAINGADSLKSDIIFPVISAAGILRIPFAQISILIGQFIDNIVGVQRINDFLLEEETELSIEKLSEADKGGGFAADGGQPKQTLRGSMAELAQYARAPDAQQQSTQQDGEPLSPRPLLLEIRNASFEWESLPAEALERLEMKRQQQQLNDKTMKRLTSRQSQRRQSKVQVQAGSFNAASDGLNLDAKVVKNDRFVDSSDEEEQGKSKKKNKKKKKLKKGPTKADNKQQAGGDKTAGSTQPGGTSSAVTSPRDVTSGEDDDDQPIEGGKLHDINLEVHRGELVIVVGGIGSGKSSLLSAVLGELKRSSGKMSLRGSVAYCMQNSWITTGTVRENILFGVTYDEEKYQGVIEACALKRDLEILSAGDRTDIGERGVNLSGGQKARISLARAVYANKDVYLLDDPLSAVDSNVSKHLFDQCLSGILRHKTRILVTHQLQYLNRADRIVVMDEGRIVEQGGFQELMDKGTEEGFLARMLLDFSLAVEAKENAAPDQRKSLKRGKSSQSIRRYKSVLLAKGKVVVQEEEDYEDDEQEDDRKLAAPPQESADQIFAEDIRKKGIVSPKAVLHYSMAQGGPHMAVLVLFMYALAQGAASASDWFVGQWSVSPFPNLSTAGHFGVYAGLAIGSAFIMLARDGLLQMLCVVASRAIHNRLLDRVSRAPMSFFETTPMGRILARFSNDLSDVDSIGTSIGQLLTAASVMLGVCVLMSISIYYMVIAFAVLLVVYVVSLFVVVKANDEVKKLESLSRAPILAKAVELATGLQTVRAFGREHFFIQEAYKAIDRNIRAKFMQDQISCWFGVRMDFIGALVVGLAGVVATAIKNDASMGTIAAPGLALSYSLTLSQALYFCMLMAMDTEANFTSIERVLTFTRTLPREAPAIIANYRPPANWPHKGEIIFDRVNVRYREGLPLVLQNVSISIDECSKVGIVGRTGSGKSTLVQALFRILECASGEIVIDGINVAKIGLQDLRSKLAVIPQEPVLFSGSVRSNLDPTGKFSDAQLWDALEKAYLKELISKEEGGLDTAVLDGGANFSVGQRQLICLARAVLRKAKIIILDEASANLDFESDALIQRTIREAFVDCTRLTVAHRLNTIIDSDKILVLDAGKVVEYDSPLRLLQKFDGVFSSLVNETGEANSKLLRRIVAEGLSIDTALDSVFKRAGDRKRARSRASSAPDALPSQQAKRRSTKRLPRNMTAKPAVVQLMSLDAMERQHDVSATQMMMALDRKASHFGVAAIAASPISSPVSSPSQRQALLRGHRSGAGDSGHHLSGGDLGLSHVDSDEDDDGEDDGEEDGDEPRSPTMVSPGEQAKSIRALGAAIKRAKDANANRETVVSRVQRQATLGLSLVSGGRSAMGKSFRGIS